MKKRIFAFCLAAVCLTSCAKGFKPVDKKSEQDNVRIEGDLQYGSLEESKTDFQNIFSQDYEKITLPDDLNMEFPERLTGFKLHEPMLDKQTATQLYRVLSPYDNADKLEWNEDERIVIDNGNGSSSNRWLAQLDNSDEHFFAEKEGLISFTSDNAQVIYDLAGAKRPDEPLISNADPNESISLSDTEASISEITSLAQNYVDDYTDVAGSLHLKPYSYDIVSNYGIIVYYERDIEGWSFGHFTANTSSNMCQNENMFGGKSGSIANAEFLLLIRLTDFSA